MFSLPMLQMQATATIAVYHPDPRERSQAVALLAALKRGYRSDAEDRAWLFGAWFKSTPLVDREPKPTGSVLAQ